MCAEARADVGELFGLRIVDGEMAAGSRHREQLRRRMARSVFAEGRVVGRAHRRRDPNAPLLVEHRVVHVVLAGPEDFVAPIRRRLRHRRVRRLRVGIAHRQRYFARRVMDRIENG